MISVDSKGEFKYTERWLKRMSTKETFSALSQFGQRGVDALSSATPRDSGLTATSWTYEIVNNARYWGIVWYNTHKEDGRPIAILLQYGHGTKNGGYVQGRDYINPAIKPIFEQLAADAWKEVTRP